MPYVGSGISLLLSISCAVIAADASPSSSIWGNWVVALNLSIAVLTVLALPFVKRIFNAEGWKSRVFGISVIYITSISMVYWTPLFCILSFGSVPFYVESTYLLFNGLLIYWWCKRFYLYFESIRISKDGWWEKLYVHEDDAVYYSQSCDKHLMNVRRKFRQSPDFLFIFFFIVVIASLPFRESISSFIGIPFFYYVLLLLTAPINLLILGGTIKGFLIYYYYPLQIQRKFNKVVYVDMATSCS